METTTPKPERLTPYQEAYFPPVLLALAPVTVHALSVTLDALGGTPWEASLHNYAHLCDTVANAAGFDHKRVKFDPTAIADLTLLFRIARAEFNNPEMAPTLLSTEGTDQETPEQRLRRLARLAYMEADLAAALRDEFANRLRLQLKALDETTHPRFAPL